MQQLSTPWLGQRRSSGPAAAALHPRTVLQLRLILNIGPVTDHPLTAGAQVPPKIQPSLRSGDAGRIAGIVSRSLAAILGGYGLAALAAMALALLPGPPEEGVLWGMMASYAVMAAAAMWCFAAKSALGAWLGILIPALPLAACIWLLPGGGT